MCRETYVSKEGSRKAPFFVAHITVHHDFIPFGVKLNMGKNTGIVIGGLAIVLLVGVVVWFGRSVKSLQNTNVSSSCIVTLFGQKYDVAQFRNIHKGGDVFACGTDMTQQYIQQHGNTPDRIRQYLTPLGN